MGQKTEFSEEEWEQSEDLSIDGTEFESSVVIKVDKNYENTSHHSLDINQASSEKAEDPANLIKLISSKKESIPALQGKKIVISRKNTGKPISAQEEDAFKKQIQDLFDLLELEKEDKNHGVRVYQTDSSPSMPWRFH